LFKGKTAQPILLLAGSKGFGTYTGEILKLKVSMSFLPIP